MAGTTSRKPSLPSGGNPQIAKAEGWEAVETYLAATPGWKQAVGRRLDALITQAPPGVRKAVRWNTPFYGDPLNASGDRVSDQVWFLGFHCLTTYVNVAFLRGTELEPSQQIAGRA